MSAKSFFLFFLLLAQAPFCVCEVLLLAQQLFCGQKQTDIYTDRKGRIGYNSGDNGIKISNSDTCGSQSFSSTYEQTLVMEGSSD